MPTPAIPPPRHELLEPEQLGRLLAATSDCRSETAAMREELGETRAELAEVRALIERGRGASLVLKVIGGVAIAIATSGGGWLLHGHLDHGEQLTAQHEQLVHVQADVSRNERSIGAVNTGVTQTQSNVSGIASELRAVHEAVEHIDEQLREGGNRRRR